MDQPKDRARLLKAVTIASVSVAVMLILVKLFAWAKTDSVSLLATLVDSSLDLLASLINLWAVRVSLRPATREYRFGQGKVEAIAGLGQSMFVAGSAVFLLLESIRHLLDPQPLEMIGYGIVVVVISIIMTLALVTFQYSVIRRTDSPAIKADALHYKTDLMVNLGVLVALVLVHFGWPKFDALIAMTIAGYILTGAIEIARESIRHLLDHELSEEERFKILHTAVQHPKVLAVHDLRTRRSGGMIFIQFHLELDDHLPLVEAHAIADNVEENVSQLFPNAEVIIHEDPQSAVDMNAVFNRYVEE